MLTKGDSVAKSRDWEVPAEDERPEGWIPDGDVIEVQAEAEDDLYQELANAAWVLKRFGGVIGIVAVREEMAPGIWRTTSYKLRWESYAPGKRLPEPEPTAEAPEAEPVPA